MPNITTQDDHNGMQDAAGYTLLTSLLPLSHAIKVYQIKYQEPAALKWF
jgi:hypothetical protein